MSELRSLQANMNNRTLQVFLTLHSAEESPEYDGPMIAWTPVHQDDRGQATTSRSHPFARSLVLPDVRFAPSLVETFKQIARAKAESKALNRFYDPDTAVTKATSRFLRSIWNP